jgi:hypothetical protein
MNSEDLIRKFELPFADFMDPIPWEGDIGFSIFKEDKEGYASLYKIGLNREQELGFLKKLYVTVSYGKKSDGGISIGTSKKITSPIDLNAYNEFFFDTSTEKFFHFDKEIEPKNILIKLKNAHIRPTKILSGLPLILKLFIWRKVFPVIIKITDMVFSFLLELFTGETVKDRDIVKRFIDYWHEEGNQKPKIDSELDEKVLGRNIRSPKQWSFLGFTSTRWSVVFYSLVHIFLYFFNSLFWKINDPIVKKVFTNSFLTLCYVAISFSIIEFLIPKILKILIRRMPKIYQSIVFKSLKVSI